jgi:hypothetical protein
MRLESDELSLSIADLHCDRNVLEEAFEHQPFPELSEARTEKHSFYIITNLSEFRYAH